MSALIAFVLSHRAQLLALAGALYTLASIVVGLLPESASKHKAIAFLERVSFIAHADSPGSVKLPGLSAIVKAMEGGK